MERLTSCDLEQLGPNGYSGLAMFLNWIVLGHESGNGSARLQASLIGCHAHLWLGAIEFEPFLDQFKRFFVLQGGVSNYPH